MATEKKSLNVALGSELIEYINDQVASGMYNNQSEVVRAALRQQQRGDKLDEALERLNDMIELGMAQVRAGKFISAQDSDAGIAALLGEAEAREQSAPVAKRGKAAVQPKSSEANRTKTRKAKPTAQRSEKVGG